MQMLLYFYIPHKICVYSSSLLELERHIVINSNSFDLPTKITNPLLVSLGTHTVMERIYYFSHLPDNTLKKLVAQRNLCFCLIQTNLLSLFALSGLSLVISFSE